MKLSIFTRSFYKQYTKSITFTSQLNGILFEMQQAGCIHIGFECGFIELPISRWYVEKKAVKKKQFTFLPTLFCKKMLPIIVFQLIL